MRSEILAILEAALELSRLSILMIRSELSAPRGSSDKELIDEALSGFRTAATTIVLSLARNFLTSSSPMPTIY